MQARNATYRDAVQQSFDRQGLMARIGARLAGIEPGRVVIEVAFSADVSQQQGYFHGAIIGAIADSAAGYAALSLLDAGSEVVTVEYKINFLRPARGRRLVASGIVERAGKALTIARSEVVCESDDGRSVVCALLQGTFTGVAGPVAGATA